MEVDKKINDRVESLGGLYMRYSDDFIIVIPDADGLDVKEQLKEIIGFIAEVPRLTLEPNKTQCYRYHEGMIEDMGEELQVKVKSKGRL